MTHLHFSVSQTQTNPRSPDSPLLLFCKSTIFEVELLRRKKTADLNFLFPGLECFSPTFVFVAVLCDSSWKRGRATLTLMHEKCVCVREREREGEREGGRGREREGGRGREREGVCVGVSVFVCV